MRAGRLLKATRAISVGGRYPWHPGRLVREERQVAGIRFALPLCISKPDGTHHGLSRHDEEDKSAFDLVRKTFPECIGVPIDTAKHNLVGYLYKADLLPLFLACLFDIGTRSRSAPICLSGSIRRCSTLKSGNHRQSRVARTISDEIVNRRLVQWRMGQAIMALWIP